MNSEFINDILNKINRCIDTDIFVDVEKTKIELKDLSSGTEWKSLKQTVCAFLNSDGGVVICGVRERNGKYHYTGFDKNNESKLIELQNKFFADDNNNFIDLSDSIKFDYVPFRGGNVAVVFIYALPDDLKFVKYNNEYYERKLTGDVSIPPQKVTRQKEYKIDIEHSKELGIINVGSINDLSLDKINRYVNLLNLEIRNESLKPSLQKAKSFLSKQHFIKDDKLTTLGMLVCGEDPFHFLGNRCEVDCYYDTAHDISRDKKIFRNDVISLMEDTFKYIWGHIKIARTTKDGGSSEPEYPEKMIREVINNALAHRDYTIDNFITVTVEPDKHVQIKNPGTFKEKIKLNNTNNDSPIRRLVPGIPESKNPKLASVLKVFDKIESQGRGMASLMNASLDNLVDLPYYEIRDNSIILTIPTGKLVDDEIENWLRSYNKYLVTRLQTILTNEHKQILAYFYKSEVLNKKRFFTILLNESNNHFNVIDQLRDAGIIYEHEISKDDAQVFILDPELMKSNFNSKLVEIVGNEYVGYEDTVKQILNLLYRFTKYNEEALKPSELTPEVYRIIFGKTIEAKRYESLARKVRLICKNLEDKGILTKNDRKAYFLNIDHLPENNLLNK